MKHNNTFNITVSLTVKDDGLGNTYVIDAPYKKIAKMAAAINSSADAKRMRETVAFLWRLNTHEWNVASTKPLGIPSRAALKRIHNNNDWILAWRLKADQKGWKFPKFN